ncbi:MAG: DUF4326 domain-containing protein [Nanoarchaeota archaeon]
MDNELEKLEYNIQIKNLRYEKQKEEYDIKVDRSSVIGNPFYLGTDNPHSREIVCRKYGKWLKRELEHNNSLVEKELRKLQKIYKKHGRVNLFCWCVPKRCHAEEIKKELIQSIINKVDF